jgi:hypothetical protein
MNIKLSDIKALEALENPVGIDIPFADVNAVAREYLTYFLADEKYKIANIRIENRQAILDQFTGKPPNLASLGLFQVAFSDYAERYILDVFQGHVMQHESNVMAATLGECEGKSDEKVRKLLKRKAKYVFKDLLMMFWCFEDLQNENND